MTLPTVSPPIWASDTNLASGPDSGLPTKESPDPSAGVIAQGFVPGVPFFAPRLNWVLNNYSKWLDYFAGLVTNRTLQIPAAALIPHTGGVLGWELSILEIASLGSKEDYADIWFPLSSMLPDGAIISRVDAIVKPGLGRSGTNRMSIEARSYTLDFTTPAAPSGSGTLAGPVGYDNAGTTTQLISTFITYTVDRSSSSHLVVRLKAGSTALADQDYVAGFRVTYTGPPSLR